MVHIFLKKSLKKKAIVESSRLHIWIPVEEVDTEVRSLQPLLYLWEVETQK